MTDGRALLLGHATCSPRWDIPKGLAEPGETPIAAALRELAEETGLAVDAAELHDLGRHPYLPTKALHLFAWPRAALPEVAGLRCRSTFASRTGAPLPEFDRFALVDWDEASLRVGRNLARVLRRMRPRLDRTWPRPD